MAKTIITQVTDDIDGTKNAETVSFSLGNDEYTIDLSTKNRSRLEAALKPYIDAGTRVSRRSTTRNGSTDVGRGKKARNGGELRAVRAWAADNGYQVSGRGRISSAVMEAYNASR